MQADDDIVIPQDELYIISWETEFDDFPTHSDLTNTSDDPPVDSGHQDAIFTDLDLRSTRRDQKTDDAATEQREQDINDADLLSARMLQDTNSDESEQMSEQPDENIADTDLRSTRPQSTTDSEMDENTSKSPTEAGNPDFLNSRGKDIIVPDSSDNEGDEMVVENESPRGGKYNLRPNPTPNFTDEYRY